MRTRRAIAGLAATAAVLCGSQAVAATTPHGVPRNRALVELELENRDGYTIAVAGFGQTVALSVARGRHPSASTTYLAHGTVTPTSIRASFADRGRIAVRFLPTGRAIRAKPQSRCGAPRDGVIGRHGVFVGELQFHGEGGYTSADVHRARGRSVDFRAFVSCLLAPVRRGRRAALSVETIPVGLPGFGAPGLYGTAAPAAGVRTHPSGGPRVTTLFADGRLPLARTAFAAQARGAGRVRFLALDERSEGSIAIVRYAQARAPSPTFVSDDALSLASVTPPPPFSGTGTLQRGDAGDKSWTGSLAVSFPGAPKLPLTGQLFSTSLTRSW
jgi:hypothetical protein